MREDNRAIIRAASAASKAADYLLAFQPDLDSRGSPSAQDHRFASKQHVDAI